MKRSDVQIGFCYRHKHRVVKILADLGTKSSWAPAGQARRQTHAGWEALNEATGRKVHVRSAAGLTPTTRGSYPSTSQLSGQEGARPIRPAAPDFRLSTEAELSQLDAILANPTPLLRIHGTAEEFAQAVREANLQEEQDLLVITPNPLGCPALQMPAYTRVALVHISFSLNGTRPPGRIRNLRTLKIWRVPLTSTARTSELSPEAAALAEKCTPYAGEPLPPQPGNQTAAQFEAMGEKLSRDSGTYDAEEAASSNGSDAER